MGIGDWGLGIGDWGLGQNSKISIYNNKIAILNCSIFLNIKNTKKPYYINKQNNNCFMK